MLGIVRYAPGQYVTEVRANNLHDIDPQHFSVGSKKTRCLPVFARDVGSGNPARGRPSGRLDPLESGSAG